jgi:hypothetical protein
MTLKELQEINNVFVRITSDPTLPLQYGLVQRDKMLLQLKKGVKPTGDRYPWMLKAAQKVIVLLGSMAEEFDAAHPGDRMSVRDLEDALRMALGKLEKK